MASNLEQYLQGLKLSQTPFFQDSTPQVSELYARGLRDDFFKRPKVAELLKSRGLGTSGMFDAPMTAKGIEQERAGKQAALRGKGDAISALETAMSMSLGMNAFDPDILRRAGAGAADWLAQYGIGEGGKVSQLPEDVANLWGTQIDPVAAASQMGANLAPFFLGVGGAGAALKATTGLAAGPGFTGGVASMLTYGLGGGAVNATEQAGRAILKGEKFDPERLAIETGIFGAGGIPGGRKMAAVVSGAAAVLLPTVMGREVDWKRAGAEALFGATFGNPRYRASRAPVKAVELDGKQKEMLSELAEVAPSQPVKEELNARVDLVDRAKKASGPELNRAMDRGGVTGLVARDALASNAKKIVPPDAPKGNVLMQRQAELIAQIRGINLPSLQYAWRKARGERRKILEEAVDRISRGQLLDGSIFKGTSWEVMPTKDLGVQPATEDMTRTLREAVETDKIVAKMPAAPAELDNTGRLLKQLGPEWELELTDIARRVEVLKNSKVADPTEAAGLEAAMVGLREKMNSQLKRETPLEITDVDQARRATEGVLAELDPAQLRKFSQELPEALIPFEAEVRKLIADRMTAKPEVEIDPITKETIEIEEALRKEGLVLLGDDIQGTRAPVGRDILPPREAEMARSPQARRMATSLQDMRREAAKWNSQVHPLEEGGKISGFELLKDGKSYKFSTLGRLRTFMGDLSEGKVKDLAGLELAAGQKGQTVTHVGDGEIMVTDMVRGKQEVHPDVQTAAKSVAEAPVQAVEADIAGGVTIPGAGGIPPSGSAPRPPLDFVNLDAMPSTGVQTWGTVKQIFMDMQEAVKFPVFDNGWRPVMDALNARGLFQKPHIAGLRKALSGIKATRYQALQDIMIAGKKQGEMAEAMGMERGELRAMRNLERWYKNLLELDDEGFAQFRNAMKTARKANGDVSRMDPSWAFEGATKDLVDDMFAGHVRLDDKNALSMAQEILMSVGRRKYTQVPIANARRTLAAMEHKTAAAMKKGGFDNKNLAAFSQAKDMMATFLDGAEHNVSSAARQVADILNKGLIPRLKKLMPKMEDVKPETIEQWSMMSTSYMSGVAMSARVALAARNMTQMLLNAPKVGFDNTFAAMAESMTAAGRKKVKDAGVFDTPRMFLWDELATEYPKVGQNILGLQRWGLGLYRWADGQNRAVSYLAGERAIRQNAKKLLDGKMDEFLYSTGIIGDSPTFQNRIKKIFKDVTPEGLETATSKAAREYGKHMAEETQFVYNRVNAPKHMQALYGRMFGQYGLWGVSFLEYNRRNLGGFTNLPHVMSGLPGPARWRGNVPLKTRYQRNFLAKQTALRASMVGLQALTGVATYNWLMANPLSFEGGPGHQMIRDLTTLTTGSGDEFQDRVAKSNVQRFRGEYWFPFGAAAHDVEESMDEPNPLIGLLLMLGFNVKTTKDRIRERRQQ